MARCSIIYQGWRVGYQIIIILMACSTPLVRFIGIQTNRRQAKYINRIDRLIEDRWSFLGRVFNTTWSFRVLLRHDLFNRFLFKYDLSWPSLIITWYFLTEFYLNMIFLDRAFIKKWSFLDRVLLQNDIFWQSFITTWSFFWQSFITKWFFLGRVLLRHDYLWQSFITTWLFMTYFYYDMISLTEFYLNMIFLGRAFFTICSFLGRAFITICSFLGRAFITTWLFWQSFITL